MRPMVKICGLTRPEDARLAAELGATHVGCVLVTSSPRWVSAEQARAVFEAAGNDVEHVLVFKGAPLDGIRGASRIAGTRSVQLYEYASEEADLLVSEGFRVFRVHSVACDAGELPRLSPPPTVEGPAVLDVGGGGSGNVFPWRILGGRAPDATFIAGGIRPGNVVDLLEHRPYGLDVSSGVERAPGLKDPEALERLFERLESP